jgi:hypothetical protein
MTPSRRRRAAVLAVVGLAALPGAAAAALPQIDYTLTGLAGDDGWYRGPVTINWTIAGATDINCVTIETLRDDTTGVQRTCTATNADGTIPAQTKVIKIDQAPPVVVATPQRPPDHGAFYTAPLTIGWSGTDATSGIAVCTATTYAGPDAPATAPTGTCRDRAGNVSAPVALPLAYDATPPALSDVGATVAADRTATVRWTPGPDAQTVTVVRAPGGAPLLNAAPASTHAVTDGPLAPGTTDTYTITVADAAGNTTTATTTATAPAAPAPTGGQSTPKPKPKPKPKALPTLRWHARFPAKYYNLQLFRNGHKVLSAWPTKPHYTLKASWRYRGKTYKLASGRYRWYVWPGYGPRTRHRYGHLLAKGLVTYPAPPIRDGGQ